MHHVVWIVLLHIDWSREAAVRSLKKRSLEETRELASRATWWNDVLTEVTPTVTVGSVLVQQQLQIPAGEGQWPADRVDFCSRPWSAFAGHVAGDNFTAQEREQERLSQYQ